MQNSRFPWSNLIFTVLVLILAYSYNYFEVINDPADGIHVWRQSDCLSIAKTFYSDNASIFKPEMHNRFDGEGKATGEFPLMYYIVSLLYSVFGVNVWVYRGLWVLILYWGLFNLYKLASQILNDSIWGMLISLFTFTAPVLIIYGISFMPDPVSLSFTFIAWRGLYEYWETKNPKLLLGVIILILVAATLKITSFISITAVIIVFICHQIIRRIRNQINTSKFVISLVPILLVLSIITSWYVYATWYNEANHVGYFFLRTHPVWEMSLDRFLELCELIKNSSRDYFYNKGLFVTAILASFILIPIYWKRLSKRYYWIYLFSFLGLISFLSLFFSLLEQHDYYVINLLFIIPLTLIVFLKKYAFIISKTKYHKLVAQGLFSILLVYSAIHASQRVEERFAFHTFWLNLDLYEFRNHLSEYGIDKEDLILVPHDPSPNITLYALDMKGWTAVNFINDPKVFQEKIDAGAKWLVVPEPSFYDNAIIDPYRDNLVVDYKGIRVYNLNPVIE